jgi:hypothetical protein
MTVNAWLVAESSELFEAELVATTHQSPARIVASIQKCSRLGWPTAASVMTTSVVVGFLSK